MQLVRDGVTPNRWACDSPTQKHRQPRLGYPLGRGYFFVKKTAPVRVRVCAVIVEDRISERKCQRPNFNVLDLGFGNHRYLWFISFGLSLSLCKLAGRLQLNREGLLPWTNIDKGSASAS
jgi:hypothetical protein